MTRNPPNHSDRGGDLEEAVTVYQRMAEMDAPALRSLAAELQRMSEESLESAVLRASSAAQARARQAAQRAAAAHEALALVETKG